MVPDEEEPLLRDLGSRFLAAKDCKTRRRFVFLSPTGLHLVTDPTFDEPGTYRNPAGFVITKTAGLAAGPDAIGHNSGLRRSVVGVTELLALVKGCLLRPDCLSALRIAGAPALRELGRDK
jgi:hypothetical protein